MKLKIKRPYAYEMGQLAPVKVENGKHTLYHHGILGMKWGRRNGPPYPLKPGAHSQSEKEAGWKQSLGGGSPKLKRAADMSNEELTEYNKRKSLENQYNKVNGLDKTPLDVSKSMLDTSSNAARQMSNNLRSDSNQKPKRERMDLHEMSNKELQAAITRENLERQYSDMFGEEKKKTGKEKAASILDGVGSTLTIAAAAVQIAIGVQMLKKMM